METYTLVFKDNDKERYQINGITLRDLFRLSCSRWPDRQWPIEESALYLALNDFDPEHVEVKRECR